MYVLLDDTSGFFSIIFCRLRKRVRFGMPGTPLSQLKTEAANGDDIMNNTNGSGTEAVRDNERQLRTEEERPLLQNESVNSENMHRYSSIN